MPIRFEEQTAILEEFCTVEEADTLLAWLMEHPDAQVDLAPCKHLHAAILQVLLSCKPTLKNLPQEDGELRAWMQTLRDSPPS
ncbi:hypothetical protein [Thiorhodospira sibirica]|uniref:hypothetical protein n=1 Tax=Thiorhodospira sibirica TaxID=154347 RepID=UPI00022C1778|nr:hypothetical protein [Thiorhodospira sibirica]